MTDILPEAEPFFMDGNDVAVLVLHGFTGTTQSMRYYGSELHRRFGFTVSGPRLAGHGTSPDDMETTDHLDWLASAETALLELTEQNKRIYVTGLSMGGTLALNLAARFSDIICGVIPINGPGGLLDGALAELICDRNTPSRFPGIGSDIKAEGVQELAYEEVPLNCAQSVCLLVSVTGSLLHKISAPIFIIQSREDHVVPPQNAKIIAERVSSVETHSLWLENSYHVATLDNDKDLIVDRVGSFIRNSSA
ncbi:MAG: alpha/beta fold hydrolase, partial [Sneathiella sp.]